jgi:hypothetical protein
MTMRYLGRLIAFGGIVFFAMSSAFGDAKIDQETLGPAGQWAGFALSPRGVHVAVLNSKGSRFIVSVDGVDGPRIDQLIGRDGNPFMAGASNNSGGIIQVPILFSDDGAHSAYFAKSGDDYILVLDSKELVRAKFQSAALSYGPLTFTTGGKHLFYGELDPAGGYHIMMDGKPGPKSHTPPKVVTSPDGAHYAYVGTQADGNDTPWAVVDGRQVKHFGDELQFTGKGHLVALLKGKGAMALNVDGKNSIVANNISQVQISPSGGELAAVVYEAKTNKTFLTINGKPVPGTEGALVQNIYFSPDDAHYAVQCSPGGAGAFIIIDGKKGQKYDLIGPGMGSIINMSSTARAWALGHSPAGQIVQEQGAVNIPGFTQDSAKFLYVAQVGLKSFLVINEDESDGYQGIAPVISPDGKHTAFLANSGGKPVVVMDGKTIALNGRRGTVSGGTTGLAFGPDGEHWIFTDGGVLYLNGVEQKDVACAGQYVYSPDSQHLLLLGSSVADPNRGGIFLDSKLVASGPGISNAFRPTFTADSKHVFWIGHRPPETSTDYDSSVLYVDGKPTAAHFAEFDAMQPGNWGVSSDGVLTFVARSGNDLKRFHVTPGADTSLTTMLASAQGAAGKK